MYWVNSLSKVTPDREFRFCTMIALFMKLCRATNDCQDIIFSAGQMQVMKFVVDFAYQKFPASLPAVVQWSVAQSHLFRFSGKRTGAVKHKLVQTKGTATCIERGWSLNMFKLNNLLIKLISQDMNLITFLKCERSRYRLQPARLQSSKLHMWHSVAGQVAHEDTKHGDRSYVRWAREYARKTIGETHTWRPQLRWVFATL